MNLKSTLKATTLGVMALFMGSKADAQTQQKDDLFLDASLQPTEFLHPVVRQRPVHGTGERVITYSDQYANGGFVDVILIVKDNGDRIVQPEEVTDAVIETQDVFHENNGTYKVHRRYDSGFLEGQKRRNPATINTSREKNGEPETEKTTQTTKQFVILQALHQLNRN